MLFSAVWISKSAYFVGVVMWYVQWQSVTMGNLAVKKWSPVPLLVTTNTHSAAFTLSQGTQASRTDLFWSLELLMPPQYLWICYVFHLEILLPLQIVITAIPSEWLPFAISFNVWCLYHKGLQSMAIFSAIIATGDYFSGNIFATWKYTIKDKGGGLFFFKKIFLHSTHSENCGIWMLHAVSVLFFLDKLCSFCSTFYQSFPQNLSKLLATQTLPYLVLCLRKLNSESP